MGRKLEFSKDKALLQAMESFWAKGYESTSMRELAQRLNLHLGSVYNALGDKEQVFEAALRLYLKHTIAPQLERITSHNDPRAALEAYIDAIVADCRQDSTGFGCFIINSLLCINSINERVSDALREYMDMHEKALSDCIARAQSAGLIDDSQNARQLARFVISSCKSMHVMKKIGANDDFIEDIRATLDRRLFRGAAVNAA